MVWYPDLLKLPPEQLEQVFRDAFTDAFREYPELIDLHIKWLSEEHAEKHRAKCIELNELLAGFEIWLKVIREEIKKARPELA
jgi:Lon protease-like protein